jgi:hypothetical protein
MNNPTFIGWQELPAGIGGGKMALFNLNEKMGEHPVGSTVSDRTLMQHGWSVIQVSELIYPHAAFDSYVTTTLRSNGGPNVGPSCEEVSAPVFELSGAHLPPAMDAAGEQLNRSL